MTVVIAVVCTCMQSGAKLVEALLRKYPKSQLVRVLKAFCAAHLNKKTTAETILDQIVEEGPQDDRVLHTMTFVYKALGQRYGMLEAYKSAVQKQPLDPDIRIGLFGYYVRGLEYIPQQQESFKLAKIDPGNADMYVWWSICSLMMQSYSAASMAQSFEDTTAERLLKLAYTMAEQRRQKSKYLSFEKFRIVCDILCGLRRHPDALDLALHFDDVCDDKVPESDISMIIGALHVRTGNLDEASMSFQNISMNNPQNWVAWHAFIATKLPELVDVDSVPIERVHGGVAELWDSLHLSRIWQDSISKIESSIDSRMLEVQTALEMMIKKHQGRPDKNRSLRLARLEAAKYKCIHNKDSTYLTSVILEAIPDLALYSSFGADLRGYISYLNEDDRKYLVDQGSQACRHLSQELQKAENSIQGQRKAFVASVNSYILQAETGLGYSNAMEMIAKYYQNVHLVKDFDPKDRGLGEELLVASIVPLIQSAESSKENIEIMLLVGLLFIERAQMERIVSAPLRLAASAIYGLLGAESLAAAQFARLDVKGVLHDSLTGHWMFPILSAASPTEEIYKKWFDGIVNLHTIQEMEARDALFTAFEQQTFSKVPEFIDFIKRLNHSATYYLYKSESRILQLRDQCLSCRSLDVHREDEHQVPRPENIMHNDDLTVRPFWYPPSMQDPTFGILSWWDFVPDISRTTSNWWMHHDTNSSKERQAWEGSTNRQIVSRLGFPIVLSSICSASYLQKGSFVVQWLEDAVKNVGIDMEISEKVNCSAVAKLGPMILSSSTLSMIPQLLQAATVLFGYYTNIYASGKLNEEVQLNILDSLEKAVNAALDKCSEVFKFNKQAAIILSTRFMQEEFVWIAQILRSFMMHCKCNGPWKHLNSMEMHLKTFSRNFISSMQAEKTEEICDSVINVDYTALKKNHIYLQGLEYLEGLDVDEILSRLAQAQSSVQARTRSSFQQIKNMLEVFIKT